LKHTFALLVLNTLQEAAISNGGYHTTQRNYELQKLSSDHEVFTREKREGWAFIISHKEKERKNDVNIARAVLTKNNRFKKQKKRTIQ
jgi:hypothetical protein